MDLPTNPAGPQPLMAWEALEVNAERVSAIVQSAAQAVSHLREASHALQVLEEVRVAQQRSLTHAEGHHGVAELGGAGQESCGVANVGSSTAPQQASSSDASSSASARAQDASEQVQAALVELLLSQRQGRREQQHAFDHLRMVLETYVSGARWACVSCLDALAQAQLAALGPHAIALWR